MKKEIKIGKRKITFKLKKTNLKEKVQFIIVVLIVSLIIYFLKR